MRRLKFASLHNCAYTSLIDNESSRFLKLCWCSYCALCTQFKRWRLRKIPESKKPRRVNSSYLRRTLVDWCCWCSCKCCWMLWSLRYWNEYVETLWMVVFRGVDVVGTQVSYTQTLIFTCLFCGCSKGWSLFLSKRDSAAEGRKTYPNSSTTLDDCLRNRLGNADIGKMSKSVLYVSTILLVCLYQTDT